MEVDGSSLDISPLICSIQWTRGPYYLLRIKRPKWEHVFRWLLRGRVSVVSANMVQMSLPMLPHSSLNSKSHVNSLPLLRRPYPRTQRCYCMLVNPCFADTLHMLLLSSLCPDQSLATKHNSWRLFHSTHSRVI